MDVDFSLRAHFMLFGSYRINERKACAVRRLALSFDGGELNLYACSVRFMMSGRAGMDPGSGPG